MEPLKDGKATLVDLLERVLDKGLVLNAELVITVSGIPLIGVNLKAALAGMTTMLKYGLMVDMDKKTREYYRAKEACGKPPLMEGESVQLRMLGSHFYDGGIVRMWRIGYFYLTNGRLLLARREPAEVLLEVPLESIKGVRIVEAERLRLKRKEIYLELDSGATLVHAEDVEGLVEALCGAVGRCRLRALT